MSYYYVTERPNLFTEDGQVLFLAIRDTVDKLLTAAGAVRSQEAIRGVSGSSWIMLACLDRMVELKELVEITQPGTMGQYRVFVRPYTD